MTLAPLSGSFRPGGPTTPRPVAGSGSGSPEPYHLQFLTAEERSTAVLMGYFQDARLEIEDFIRNTGDLSVADATYYRQLLDETNRIASTLNSQGAKWTSSTIDEAYSAGWRQNSSIVVPQKALEALSRDTLSLISQTTDGIRQAVRQSIAQGILQGLPADQVRARILASGLSNIPHWPSAEYRAGVIARTETMRAYNAGHLAAMEENGARYAEWIASPDEAVCSICGPRDGVIFRLDAGMDLVDPYPNAQSLPKLPAHPRCRCTTRPVYRDPDGKVIGTPNAQDPKLPKDAMGGNVVPPKLPPSVGDFPEAVGGLKGDLQAYLNGGADGTARQKFWRTMGRLDDDQIRMIAGGKTNAAGHAATDAFLRLRYGIKLGKITGWNADLRHVTISALERIRALNAAFVTDSRYLHTIGDRPPGAGRFGSNVIARAFASGHVEGNMKSWSTFTTRKLRGGSNVNAAEEVILHEYMHTVHNRFGQHDVTMVSRLGGNVNRNPYTAVEPVDRSWHEEYQSIRSRSSGVAPDEGSIAKLEENVAKFQGYVDDPGRAWLKQYNEDALARAQKALDETRAALNGQVDHEYYPTSYGQSSYGEDFAESGMLFFLNPDRLKKFSPLRYEFMRDKVFGGQTP